MNLTSPVLKGAAGVAELPGDFLTSFLKMVGDNTDHEQKELAGGNRKFGLALVPHTEGTLTKMNYK